MGKKTAIIGATTNPGRYAYLAAQRLKDAGHEIVPLGIKKGHVAGEAILNLREKPEVADVDTITMYIGPQHQAEWEGYIQSLKPGRVIFNPGTENSSLERKLKESGVEVVEGCTLVMLSIGNY